MIKISNLTKSFGARVIFDAVSFNLNPGEHAGLVGRNGHGKTTLFRMLTGDDHPDSGEIYIPKNYTLGYLTQKLEFRESTVIDEACSGLPEHRKDDRWLAEKILFGLGFTVVDMGRHPSEFSGGFQVRLNLAQGARLRAEPAAPGRADELPGHRLHPVAHRVPEGMEERDHPHLPRPELHGQRHHPHPGDPPEEDQKDRRRHGQALRPDPEGRGDIRKDPGERREEEEGDGALHHKVPGQGEAGGPGAVPGKGPGEAGQDGALEKIENLDFSFRSSPFTAKSVMGVRDLSFAYDKGSPLLFGNLSFTIGKNDRICVIGRNGKGKTTLLRILAGELKPDTGEISTHPSAAAGYYAQTNTVNLNDALTIEEEVMAAGIEKQEARNICGAMMFEGDAALKKIGVLSGGEKCRVLLGKILAKPCNLLLLDEPTNHLDMESTEAFMAAVDQFNGAVVIVTHNQLFLQALATRFIVFQGGRAFLFEGSYSSFLEKIGWENEEPVRADGDALRGPDTAAGVNKKDLRKMRADIVTGRSRDLKPLEKMIAGIEESITVIEKDLARMNNDIIEASQTGKGEAISLLSREIHAAKQRTESLYGELDELTRRYDERAAHYDERMRELDQ